jgi:hypothetical protein
MLLSLLLGAPTWLLLRWMVLSILVWTVLLTAATALGLEVFHSLPLARRFF